MKRFVSTIHVRLGHDVAEKIRRIAYSNGETVVSWTRRIIYLAASESDAIVHNCPQLDTGNKETTPEAQKPKTRVSSPKLPSEKQWAMLEDTRSEERRVGKECRL